MYQITELNTNARFGVSGLSTNRNIATACIVNNQNNQPSANSFSSSPRNKDGKRETVRQTFFTLQEMMAANLRSLLSAYAGLWQWPEPPAPIPLDLCDIDQVTEAKKLYQAAQLELGIV